MTIDTTKEKADYLRLNALANRYDAEGKMQLDKDKEAARAYFLQHVNPNTVFFHDLEEKLNFLWDNEYYEREPFEQFDFDYIKSLYRIAYNYKFRFPSFVGAYKFYNQYALKTFDGQRYLERFEDRVVANAILLSGGVEQEAENLIDSIMTGAYQPATPTFLNAIKKQRGSFVSCYLVEVSDDMNSIGRAWNSAAQLSKNGGGVAFNLTNLRAAGDPIKQIEGAASGVLGPAKVMENIFSYANQLGARQGAGAVYLNAHHLDVLDFLNSKKIAGDDNGRLETLHIGLVIPDITMELFRNGEDMYLFSPYDVSKKYGIPFAEVNITEKYRELVDDPSIRKNKIAARKFFSIVSDVLVQSGDPYILFEDTANRDNRVPGKIKQSNLCTEILQPQVASVLNDDQTYQHLGRDISCNLGSINIARALEGNLEIIVDTAVRSLSWVATHSDMTVVPSIKDGNEKARAIGLGAMNLHGWLSENKIEYGSPEAIEATELYFYLVNYYALITSNELSIETGQVFDGFEQSKYKTDYFDQYISNPLFPSDAVSHLFPDNFPTEDDWQDLAGRVKKHGLYNQNLQAVAPTASISYVNGSVPSILPCTAIVESRSDPAMGTVYFPAPGLREDNKQYYKDAYQLGWKAIVDTVAAAQKHVDQGISCTLFFLDSEDTREITKAYYYAFKQGLKTLYYIRTQNDVLDGMEDRGCVSCSI